MQTISYKGYEISWNGNNYRIVKTGEIFLSLQEAKDHIDTLNNNHGEAKTV